ncbi:MAG: hypothetical protein IKO52_14160 [Clostridia bacterium]|nr:hypothetical protein [Clostridia bacterium]
MEQHVTLSPCEMIMILRRQLEEAYDQGSVPVLRELSRRMDDIQLRHWEAQIAQAS